MLISDLDTSFGIETPHDATRVQNPRVSAVAITRAKRQEAVAERKVEALESLIGRLDPGTAWHCITTGDIDSGSYLDLLIRGYGPFEHAYISTWRIAREYINRLERYLQQGQLGGFTLFTGDYFAARYPADYTRVCNLADTGVGRVYRWLNHAKMFALRNPQTGWACVLETSANMTANPRTEQTVITVDADLYRFYRHWFEDTAHERKQYRLPG